MRHQQVERLDKLSGFRDEALIGSNPRNFLASPHELVTMGTIIYQRISPERQSGWQSKCTIERSGSELVKYIHTSTQHPERFLKKRVPFKYC